MNMSKQTVKKQQSIAVLEEIDGTVQKIREFAETSSSISFLIHEIINGYPEPLPKQFAFLEKRYFLFNLCRAVRELNRTVENTILCLENQIDRGLEKTHGK